MLKGDFDFESILNESLENANTNEEMEIKYDIVSDETTEAYEACAEILVTRRRRRQKKLKQGD